MLGKIFVELLNMSLTAGMVIVAVLLLRFLLRRAPKIFSYCLWAVVLFRLLCPVSFQTPVSLLGTLGVESTQEGGVAYIKDAEDQLVTDGSRMFDGLLSETVKETVKKTGGTADWNSENSAELSEPSKEAWHEGGALRKFLWPEGFSGVMWIGMLLWLAGIWGLVLYGVVSVVRLRMHLRSAEEEVLEGNIGVYHSDKVAMPFVLGLLHPRIYLPKHLEKRERSYILLHERIHICRRDPIFRMLAYMALCLHWFNPLVWLAFFLSERDMEMSCDEAVIRKLGNQVKKEYTTSLLSLATGRRGVSKVSLAFAEGDTGGRIRNILRYRKPAAFLMGLGVAISLLASLFLLGNPASASQELPQAAPTYVWGVLTDVSDWKYKADGGQYQTFLLKGASEPYFVTVNENTTIEPYFEFDMSQGLKDGDLVRLIFPEGAMTTNGEEYPRQFQTDPETIEVLGRGFELEYLGEDDGVKVSMPLGRVPDAVEGAQLEILFGDGMTDDSMGDQSEIQASLESIPVVEVDPRHQKLYIILTKQQTEIYLEQFVFATVRVRTLIGPSQDEEEGLVQAEPSSEGSERDSEKIWGPGGELLALDVEALEEEKIPDGEYLVDRYKVVNFAEYAEKIGEDPRDLEFPELEFSTVCGYWVASEEGKESRYAARDFQDFSISVKKEIEESDSGELPLRLTFYNGQIVEAFLDDALQYSEIDTAQ